MLRRLAPKLLATCLCLAAYSAAQAEDRALVIGINKYPGITYNGTSGVRDLRGAVSDAGRFADLLVSHFGFKKGQVKLLTDSEASRSGIIDAFETWLVQDTKPGDRAVLYFAGHGAQTLDENGDEAGGDKFDEALVPADATGELSAAPVKLSRLLIDDKVGDLLSKLQGRDVLVVIDACHSGTATRGLDGASGNRNSRFRTLTPYVPALTRGLDLSPEMLKKRKIMSRLIDVVPDKGQTAIWTATASGQIAFDLDNGGLFTLSFIEGLKSGKADRSGDGKVSAIELLNYVRKVSKDFCETKSHLCRFGLTPTLESSEDYRAQVLVPIGEVANTSNHAEKSEQLFSHENDFSLSVEIHPGTKIKLGSEVTFKITSSKPGHLLLFDEGPDGKFRQIFPNARAIELGKLGGVRAHAPLKIPDASYGFAFEATDKGKGTLIALVAEEAADLKSLASRQLDFEPLTNVEKVLAAIAKRLHAPYETEDLDKPNRAYRWSFATVKYEVE